MSPLQLAYPRGAEIFVLEGTFSDGQGTYGTGSWMRLPPGFEHAVTVAGHEQCIVYVKEGGLAYLREGQA